MHNNIIIKFLDSKNGYLKLLLLNKIYYIPKNINENIIFDEEIIFNSKIIKTNSDFYNILKKELNLNNIRIKCGTRIIPDKNIKIFIIDKFFKNTNIYDKGDKDNNINTENNNENKDKFFSIEIYHPLNGGNAIDDIKNAFESIAQVFETFGKFLLFIIKMIIWVIRVLIWFSIEFLNPIKIFSDIFGSITRITKIIIISGVDIIFALLKYLFNIILGYLFNGTLMGWDQETYKEEKEAKLKKKELEKELEKELLGSESDEKSEFTNTEENSHYEKDKCYKTPPGQIPFSIIIMSILCPPLGIFMQYGLSFWLNIVICCLLTMMYYIPGLLYTLILLYC